MTLDIENRTENWKTARTLSPLFGDRAVTLARRLGEPRSTPALDVSLELFWKGARDCCHGKDKQECAQRLVANCRRLFRKLGEQIEAFDGFRELRDGNYNISSESHKKRLLNNMLNTEIDVVVKSPGHLYIGEAKYKSGFHADGNLVLVHQLVRQYVTASVLVDVTGSNLKVAPFVITNKPRDEKSRWPDQIRFMLHQRWMNEGNRLTWAEVKDLRREAMNLD